MTDRKVLIVIGACALAGVCVLVAALWPSSNNPNFPEGLAYLCPNGHEFHLTVSQLNDFYLKHYGEPLPCPVCGATPAQRAERDPQTGKLRPIIRDSGALPVPGQPQMHPPRRAGESSPAPTGF